jgi:hypothetical protein
LGKTGHKPAKWQTWFQVGELLGKVCNAFSIHGSVIWMPAVKVQ